MKNTELTRTMKSVINIINKNLGNPETVTRAQIQELVTAGDFRWPYFITDHKHGHVVKRGVYRVPTSRVGANPKTAAAPSVPVATAWFAIDPKGSKVTVKFDEPVTAEYAATAMVASRARAKKSSAWVAAATLTSIA